VLKIISLLFYFLLYTWAAVALVMISGIVLTLARQRQRAPSALAIDPHTADRRSE
jgi:uncharacterized membrane protein